MVKLAYTRVSGYMHLGTAWGRYGMRTLTKVFKALSDETRLQMLGLLLHEGELCVCDFVEVLEITQSKASRHLRSLVDAGLLDDRREAVWVYFKIAAAPEAAQGRVLDVLPTILEQPVPADLARRLDEWRRHKAQDGGACVGATGGTSMHPSRGGQG